MRNKFYIAPFIMCICVFVDQCSKLWARHNLTTGINEPFIPYVLQLNLTTNTGGAFSLASGNNGLMTIFVLLFTLGIAVWIIKRERSSTKPSIIELAGMGLLVGGAISNLCDRLTLGRVTDFLCLSFVSFPIFNFADVCIDCGLVLIIAASCFTKDSHCI